ncbi:CopG family transcriptional regulator [Chloroflexota bacterium]
MKKEEEKRTISLPTELYQRIEERVKATEFSSMDEYVSFVLEELLKEDEEKTVLDDQDEEEVKKRLRALGYLG